MKGSYRESSFCCFCYAYQKAKIKIFHLFTVLTRILPYMFYELDDGLRESFSRSRRCSVIKGVLKFFLQIPQENTSVGVSF